MHGCAGEIHVRRFSDFRHCERDDHYGFHGDRDNDSEFRIRTTFDANDVENAVAADAEFPYSFRIGITSCRFNGCCTQFKTTPCPCFCAPNRERGVDHQLRRRWKQRWWWWKLWDTLGHSDNHRCFERCEPLRFPKLDGELIRRRK